MSTKNPFTLSFGRKPIEYINRYNEEDKIYDVFINEPITDQIYILTGIRGSGKTVAMTNICEKIEKLDDWIIIKISPVDDILDAFFKNLIYNKKINKICLDAKVDFSLFGFNLSLDNKMPEKNLIQAIDDILKTLQKKNIKVLVAIDEVTNTPQMIKFISAFQLYITNNRPIFFLGTALLEELKSLQNVKNLTFLYRAPKIILTPLNLRSIANTYKRVFNCDEEKSTQMAFLTKGYPLAFQILGYVIWESGDIKISNKILEEFDQRIADVAYTKIWSDLSKNDKKVIIAIEKSKSKNVIDIRKLTDMDINNFNQYRRRLKQKGLIDVSEYGSIEFSLPRFKEFVSFLYYDVN